MSIKKLLLSTLLFVWCLFGTSAMVEAASPDNYEPNDTKETAYSYGSVNTISTKITNTNSLFDLGMKNASLHSATDVDWYSIYLVEGQQYFMDLRNIGGQDWYIELYYYDSEGEVKESHSTNQDKYDGKAEKYQYFTAQHTGTYYIKIASKGEWESSLYYYFYVGPVWEEFEIENLATEGNIWVGANYSTYSFDLRNAVPKQTKIIELSLSDSFISSATCSNMSKRLTAGGRSYYNTVGREQINGISGASLGQVWKISACCASGAHRTQWSARMNGRFSCKMAPFPGNEIK